MLLKYLVWPHKLTDGDPLSNLHDEEQEEGH
jgi:hypothetical protein